MTRADFAFGFTAGTLRLRESPRAIFVDPCLSRSCSLPITSSTVDAVHCECALYTPLRSLVTWEGTTHAQSHQSHGTETVETKSERGTETETTADTVTGPGQRMGIETRTGNATMTRIMRGVSEGEPGAGRLIERANPRGVTSIEVAAVMRTGKSRQCIYMTIQHND